jgi:UDP-N-acetylglucosamine 2-epimerase (non-hydrolysing)
MQQLEKNGAGDKLKSMPHVAITPPLGYLDFIGLLADARLVLTDSGGVQEETTILSVPCLTLRENTERPVTITHGTNRLVGLDPQRIVSATRDVLAGNLHQSGRPELWDGHAAGRVVKILREKLSASSPSNCGDGVASARALHEPPREP